MTEDAPLAEIRALAKPLAENGNVQGVIIVDLCDRLTAVQDELAREKRRSEAYADGEAQAHVDRKKAEVALEAALHMHWLAVKKQWEEIGHAWEAYKTLINWED